MSRHKRTAAYLQLLVMLLVLGHSACTTTSSTIGATGQVHHVVICWLKQPGDSAARSRLVEVSRSFASLPGVLQVTAGAVLPSDRGIVDSSFDVAIVMTFANRQALADYLESPRHRQATHEVLRPLTSKVIVYDFVS
jgi:hypothetical protein